MFDVYKSLAFNSKTNGHGTINYHYKIVTLDGEIIKKFRKAWEANTDGCLDKVMAEYAEKTKSTISTVSNTGEEDT